MIDLEIIYHRLVRELRGDKNVCSVGMGRKSEFNPEEYLVIYTVKKAGPKDYPTLYKGVPVKVVKTGGFAPLGKMEY